MSEYDLDEFENGKRAAVAGDDWFGFAQDVDTVEMTGRGLILVHHCAHCGLRGGH